METKTAITLSIAIVVAAAILSAGMVMGPQSVGQAKYYTLLPTGSAGEKAAGLLASAIPLQITENVKTISTNGVSEITMDAEKVDLYFSVETKATEAAKAQQDNAAKVSAVRNALIAMDIAKEKIETTDYSLQEMKEYNYETKKYEFEGYQTTHSLKVSLAEINNAGTVIDAAINAGANRVDNVVFGLNDSTVEQLRKQALQQAAQNAREKADSIAAGLNVKITGIQTASESTYYYPMYEKSYMAEATAGAPAPTEFVAGAVKVTANVSVSFIIE